MNEDYVQIRHFTIIDEAHYMLDFDNQPLRNLIAVGRNKGLSIIFATQNMDSYKSRFFDFYANAQYPLIMKQQTISDSIIKDIFGVSGKYFQEIKSAIAGLQKGELIIKDHTMAALGLGGKPYKKIKVTHLIWCATFFLRRRWADHGAHGRPPYTQLLDGSAHREAEAYAKTYAGWQLVTLAFTKKM